MRWRAAAYVVTGLAVTGLWLGLLFLPLRKEKADLSERIADAHHKITDFSRVMAALPDFLKEHGDLENQKRRLSSRLYAKEDILMLFEHLERLATQHRLETTEISPPVEELLRINRMASDSAGTERLKINMKLRGSYVDFGRFLGNIEEQDFFRGVSDCKITAARDAPSAVHMQLGFYALLSSLEEAT